MVNIRTVSLVLLATCYLGCGSQGDIQMWAWTSTVDKSETFLRQICMTLRWLLWWCYMTHIL